MGVAYVVEGSVRKAGNRVRINAQLIEGATGGHLWADRYDRDLTDIFAVQDEITKTIVEQLKVKLLPEEKKAIEQAPTGNVEAYTHYLRGLQFFHTGTKSSLTLGRHMFARAVELDPRFARAYAGMANCDSRLYSKHRCRNFRRRDPGHRWQGTGNRSRSRGSPCGPRQALMIGSDRPAKRQRLSSRRWRSIPIVMRPISYYAEFWSSRATSNAAAQHYLRAIEIQPDDIKSPLFLSNALSVSRAP